MFRRKAPGPAVADPPPQAGASRPDASASFPRGLPDGDPYKPMALGRWPAAAEVAQWMPEWSPGATRGGRPGMFLLGRDQAGRYYGYSDNRHILTVAGSRAGKGVSLIIPNLLFWPGSAICIDPKGELASLTASRRSAVGSKWSSPITPGEGRVYALDPFRRVTGDARQFADACFNPLTDLDHATDAGGDLAYQIADALIIQAEGEGAHWTQSARSFLRGLILFVCATEPPHSKNLITVRRLVMQGKEDLVTTFAAMADLRDKNELVSRIGSAMRARPPYEIGSIISACETQTSFLDGEAMKRVVSSSTFRLEDLKAERITIYLCLPAMNIATHGRWLRLIVSLAMEAMERTGPLEKGKPPVLFVLDEFAALGKMESVEKAAGQIASFGVTLWPIIQDLSQLKRDYKDSWETFMGNAGLLTFHGTTDISTAEHIAKRLGETEVIRPVMNANETWGQSENENRTDALGILLNPTSGGGASGSGGITKGGTRSLTQQVQKAPLMHPTEIIQSFARDTGKILIVIPDYPPFALYRCVYYSQEDNALFGGLVDDIPGQDPPRTNRAQREARQG